MYALKVQYKKFTRKTIILSENAQVVNVKRLKMCMMGNTGGSTESSVSTNSEISEGKGDKQQTSSIL